jgi:hypothetical protein
MNTEMHYALYIVAGTIMAIAYVLEVRILF